MHFHVKAATGKQNGGQNNDKSASLYQVVPAPSRFGPSCSGPSRFSPTIKKKRKKQLLKEILSSDGQQFHQYQRKEQSPLISNH